MLVKFKVPIKCDGTFKFADDCEIKLANNELRHNGEVIGRIAEINLYKESNVLNVLMLVNSDKIEKLIQNKSEKPITISYYK